MINEQGHCLDVRDHISEKILYMFSNKSLVYGALEIIFIADYQALVPLLQMLYFFPHIS